MRTLFAPFLLAVLGLALAGCAAKPTVTPGDVDRLAMEIRALGPEVDPGEAERAARIAYGYSLQLAEDWEVTDPPLVHNAKVLHGLRERGLCNHWTEDILARLSKEEFRTLELHWATSPPEGFRVIHHSAVISRRGDSLYDGILLDPWRYGGVLYWSEPRADPRYDWAPRLMVRDQNMTAEQARQAALAR